MVYFTTSVTTAASSVPGAGTVCNLNWIGGKPTTVSVFSTNSGSSISFQVQYTLDDVQRVASSLVYWQSISSAYSDTGVTTSSGSIFTSSTVGDITNGITFSLLSPWAGVRLNSTGMASGPLFMKVIQGEGW